jgi:CBS domain-containing membrane protein
MRITRVKDVMTDVVETLQVGDTLALARRQIERGRVHHLPVVDADEHVIGLLTYHRILEAWIGQDHADTKSAGQAAGDIAIETVMEKDVLTVDAETTAAEAAGLLNNNRFGSLPVTKNEKLVGIVTAGDFMRVALRYLDRELHEL